MTQNREDIQKLESKLRWLDNHMFLVPIPPQGISQPREDLTRCVHRARHLTDLVCEHNPRQLNATLTRLRNMREKHKFRYLTVAQTISECSRDIDHYLQCYTVR